MGRRRECPGLFWAVPDWGGVGAFLTLEGDLPGEFDLELDRVVGGPAGSRDLDDAGVVEGGKRWIEIGIGPDGAELGGADGVCPGGNGEVHGIADGRLAAAFAVDLAAAGNGDIVDAFPGLAVCVEPALDDLDAVEVGSFGVAQGVDEEAGGFAFGSVCEVAAHGHSLAVADLGKVAALSVFRLEVEAAEEADAHARAGGGVDLAALHGIEEGPAGVGLGPDGGQAAGDVAPAAVGDVEFLVLLGEVVGAFGVRFVGRELAEEIVVVGGGEAGVGVAGSDKSELEGVGSELLLEFESALQTGARAYSPGSIAAVLASLASRLPQSQVSKSANSSSGESIGWASPSPLIWVAS